MLGSAGPVNGDPVTAAAGDLESADQRRQVHAEGGKTHVTLKTSGSHVQIVVSDTGQGIRAEFLPYVFERFRQADSSTTRRHGGLGLGLSIVKNLVEMHGGLVEAASGGENHGAVFTVHLPLAPTHQSAAAEHSRDRHGTGVGRTAGAQRRAASSSSTTRPMRAIWWSGCSASAGANVVPAHSAIQALDLLRDGARPDVIVSDIGMPDQDGYEFIRRVRGIDGIAIDTRRGADRAGAHGRSQACPARRLPDARGQARRPYRAPRRRRQPGWPHRPAARLNAPTSCRCQRQITQIAQMVRPANAAEPRLRGGAGKGLCRARAGT